MIKNISVPAGLETTAFVMGADAIAFLPEFLQQNFPGKKPWIVADDNTWLAAGKRANDLLTDSYAPEILPGTPRLHPDTRISDMLSKKISAMPDCLPVAIGSGVINDLVKVAAGNAGVRYCCVPTAASVDGYTSSGGAMAKDGFKMTVPCPAPYGLLVDSTILQSAPPEMFAAGYADLFAKIPAGGDWIIADAMGIEKIDPAVWDLVQTPLRSRLADPNDFEPVFAGLAATGYAMQYYHDSRPASGAEHLFSHVWEMENLTNCGEDISHGFKVAVGSIASTLLQEFIINTPREAAQKLARPTTSPEDRSREIDILLRRNCYGSGVKELAMSKFEDRAARAAVSFEIWDSLPAKLSAQLIPTADAINMLRKAGSPVFNRDIGISRDDFIHGIYTAQLIRKRYTVLDFLYDAGLLDAAVAYLEKSISSFN